MDGGGDLPRRERVPRLEVASTNATGGPPDVLALADPRELAPEAPLRADPREEAKADPSPRESLAGGGPSALVERVPCVKAPVAKWSPCRLWMGMPSYSTLEGAVRLRRMSQPLRMMWPILSLLESVGGTPPNKAST